MVIRKLVTVLGYKVDKKGLKDGESSLTKFASRGKLILAGMAAAGVAAIGMLGKSAVNAAAEMESMNASFEVMLGSAEKAQAMIKDIEKTALETPFDFMDFSQGAKMMLSFGIASEQVMENLRMLGDIAGTDKEKLKGLTLAFSQMSATGRLMGQDLLQMINAGFNPLQEISRKTGKSMAALKKDMEKGAISAKMVRDAFKSATSEGGRFYKNMEKQAGTFNGQWSKLWGLIKKIKVEIGKQFLGPLTDGLKGVNAWLEEKVIPNLDVWSERLRPVAELFDWIYEIIAAMPEAFAAMTKALEPEIKLVKELASAFWEVVTAVYDAVQALAETEAVMWAVEGIGWIITKTLEGWTLLFKLVADGWRKLTSLFEEDGVKAKKRAEDDDSFAARLQRARAEVKGIKSSIGTNVMKRREVRIQNINIKQTNNIKAPAAKDGTTGLSADGLAKVNQESSKALFAMQLSRLTYASTGA